jgi:hypothetical protein
MFKHLMIAAATASLATATASAADWRVTQIHQGGGRTTTVVVREHADRPTKAPYALTGQQKTKTSQRVVQRWSGPRYIGPVVERER